MMIKPGISELMQGMESRYTLAMIVAKRARELALDTTTPLVKVKSDKPVTIAVHEVAEGLIDVISHDGAYMQEEPKAPEKLDVLDMKSEE